MYVTRPRGFTLIEVMIVLAIIAISLSLAGPRIGAGIGRLELHQAAQTARQLVNMARIQAQRVDRGQYVVFDKDGHSISLVSSEMKVLRSEQLPSSVEIVLNEDARSSALYVAPSGVLRGGPVRLRGRAGEIEVARQ